MHIIETRKTLVFVRHLIDCLGNRAENRKIGKFRFNRDPVVGFFRSTIPGGCCRRHQKRKFQPLSKETSKEIGQL